MEQDDSTTYHYPIALTIFACLLGLAFPSKGQELGEGTEDPLNKPQVWKTLESRPSDSASWSSYYDKPLICLSSSELKQLKACREGLMAGLGEVVIETQTDHVDWERSSEEIDEEAHSDISQEQNLLEQETAVYLARLEKSFVEESQTVKELKDNIAMNFFIIEDLYAEEFRELGQEYHTYLSQYPNEEYDKSEWISEKEKELAKLKKKHFKKIKKQVMENARKHHQLSQMP